LENVFIHHYYLFVKRDFMKKEYLSLTQEQKDRIKKADKLGMKFVGFNEDNEMEFIGTEKQWNLLDE